MCTISLVILIYPLLLLLIFLSNVSYPLFDLTNFGNYPHDCLVSSANVLTIQEPRTYLGVFRHKEWVDAMQKKLDALEHNHTCELITLLFRKKAISSK